ncbi:type II 3-dehydroquinate dehydratase [Telmatospirillum sp. J64-1]|uniref:type II 3-dehydroquinate dehydratase n=1 Tax=Telmatospirillum sp. J64-1 TaxID=2502183 RepID=UPI00163D7BD6|nr:type II 3-dehydroquinate dehydratase [Telmatospirillum sp. J64-1]
MTIAGKILFLNGPNANLYGHQNVGVYGAETFESLGERVRAAGRLHGLEVDFRQSNSEGVLIDWVQEAVKGAFDGICINAAGLTYTSIALLDALLAFPGPILEVHMSNIFKREPFRHHSYISKAATGMICGLGGNGYVLAVQAMAQLLAEGKEKNA